MYQLTLIVLSLLAFGCYTYWILRGEGVFARHDREAAMRRRPRTT
jgi:hypothetical protein